MQQDCREQSSPWSGARRCLSGASCHGSARLVGIPQRCSRGARPECAFRVIVDPLGEAARQPDLGRLVVELHVAPAQPLRFLQVRLIQAGPEGLVVQEV